MARNIDYLNALGFIFEQAVSVMYTRRVLTSVVRLHIYYFFVTPENSKKSTDIAKEDSRDTNTFNFLMQWPFSHKLLLLRYQPSAG
jgi:hypothetical protein